MSALDQRPPPCHHCGLVDPAFGHTPDGYRHVCSQAGILGMRYDLDAMLAIGKALVSFLTLRAV